MEEDSQSFMFKLPLGTSDDSSNVDLKWLGEQLEQISSLLNNFNANYKQLVQKQKCPPELLRAHAQVVKALTDYQIALLEQQNRRHFHISSEADMQEMMSQLETLMRNFRNSSDGP